MFGTTLGENVGALKYDVTGTHLLNLGQAPTWTNTTVTFNGSPTLRLP
jgi:hypothetical protein